MKVYYQSTRTRREDYLRTPDYFFRYDRGVTNVHPKSLLGRLLFGKLLDSSQLLRLAREAPLAAPRRAPDRHARRLRAVLEVAEFMDWYEREIGFFPLWCVPYRRVRDYEWLADEFYARTRDELFLDLAIYGMRQRRPTSNYHAMIEEKLLEIGGIKTLISHNYYSEDEFWRIWNKPELRRGEGDHRPRQPVPRPLHEDLPRLARAWRQATAPLIPGRIARALPGRDHRAS